MRSERDLANFVLGVLGLSERVEALARVPSREGSSHGEHPLAFALLGILSIANTLRAHACLEERAEAIEPSVSPESRAEDPSHASAFRGALR